MLLRLSTLLLLVALLSGCSLFQHDEAAAAAPKKHSIWPLGHDGPQDATAFIEYQRAHSASDKNNYTLSARNTHVTKAIEGDIRTTIETATNETKVDTSHFTLAPNETKQLLVYPDKYHLTYEVSAVFRE